MLRLKTINNVCIDAVPMTTPPDERPVLGADLFPTVYDSTFICSRKKSGKSHLLYRILEQCTNKNTNIFVICPTHERDPVYTEIKRLLAKRKQNAVFFDDIIEEDGSSVLDKLIAELRHPPPEEPKKAIKKPKTLAEAMFAPLATPPAPRCKRSKYQTPEHVLIIDDCSHNLRHPSVSRFLKIHRHLHVKCFLSSQAFVDVAPSSFKQIDNLILFRSMDTHKLEILWAAMDLHVGFDTLAEMYRIATDEPYSFLNVNCRLDTYRVGFSRQFNV
jgi:hypothetical protein